MARHSADTRRVFKSLNGVQWLCALLINLIVVLLSEVSEAKVFERCELAKVLRHKHALSLPEVAIWVCIAQHSSGFNTDTHASGLEGGSHGLYQISDVYWCSPPGKGSGCNLQCSRLRDADLTDDLQCMHRIFDEHQRISGDGYTAWNAYSQFCRNGAQSYIEGCFPRSEMDKTFAPAGKPNFLQVAAAFKKQAPNTFSSQPTHLSNFIPTSEDYGGLAKKRGKIYNRCELAQELYFKHKMPMEEIPTWVCIAEHESRFDTSAVGRLNADGSADHGLFQISDLFWCSKDPYRSKACGLQCSKLLDDDITDDVRCIRRIYGEHTAISGDGFTAWTVYNQHCRNQQYQQVSTCFPKQQSITGTASTQVQVDRKSFYSNAVIGSTISAHNQFSYLANKPITGKVYKRCELAQELYFIHKFPMQDIATWLCIAQHESNYNTAAVGRLNADGSADHGLFQISDLFWCSQDSYSGGKACNIPCHKLLDSDITDDVRCVKTIYEEHTRISGDGFTAWTVYNGNCRNQRIEQISSCFDSKEIEKGMKSKTDERTAISSTKASSSPPSGAGKIYKQCELAQELYFKHKMPMEEIPTWVCIAQHESSFNTAAVGRLNTDGSADHGLFQISDLYWCSHDSYGGKACNIPCNKLLDSDITDDVRCVRTIYEEHTRISGDGFTAWTVYKPHCRQQRVERIANCFNSTVLAKASEIQKTASQPSSAISPSGPRKIYKKCELAQELYFKHKMPMNEIPTWVCIAQHESSFNTAAVGRLNTDGSADHGLFQISDLYWCTHDSYGGKACNIPCNKLLDSDITDDVRCVRTIYDEHTRISGDGFTAWTVYKPHCRQQSVERIADCFNSTTLAKASEIQKNTYQPPTNTAPSGPRKVYKKCELAQELYFKHKMPMDEIPTWVCIAQHESSFNTAAVGRLNTDGSADHGLFQISDLYWCSHDSYGGKACNIPCNKLLDSDITDDVRCVRTIYEEHTRISGDGFTAWTVYGQHCRNQHLNQIETCFDNKVISMASQVSSGYAQVKQTQSSVPVPLGNLASNPFLKKYIGNSQATTIKPVQQSSSFVTKSPAQNLASGPFSSNPFLNSLSAATKQQGKKTQIQETGKISLSEPAAAATENNYNNNPFLQKISTASRVPNSRTEAVVAATQQNSFLQKVPTTHQPTTKLGSSSTLTATTRRTGPTHPTKKYVLSDSFRKTPKTTKSTISSAATTTTTTRKPTTTWKATTTTKKPSTNWRTSSSATTRTTALPKTATSQKSTTTTTSKPTTNWRATTATTTTTKKTTTTQKPKTTTGKKPRTVWWTPSSTTTPKTTTIPKTTTTRAATQSQKLTATTTTKKPTTVWWTPSSTTTPKTVTTQKTTTKRNASQSQKLTATTTTKRPTTVWWTPSSTTTAKTTTTQKTTTKRSATQPQKLPTTTTMKKPTTVWWTPSSTTTPKTTTILKTTTTRTTTKSQKLTAATTTTKKPTTVWWTQSSTTTPKTTTTQRTTTIRSPIQPQKFTTTTTTTKKATTVWSTPSSKTTAKTTTTPKPSTTRITYQPPTLTSTTTKKTTTNWRTPSSTTTSLPKTTTTQKTTTKRTTTTTNKPTKNWKTPNATLTRTTTTTQKPTTTRYTSSTTTKKPSTIWWTPNSSTTTKPKLSITTVTTTTNKPSTNWKTTNTKATTTSERPKISTTTTQKTTQKATITTTKKPTTDWRTTDWRTTKTTTITTKKPTTIKKGKTTKATTTTTTRKPTAQNWKTTKATTVKTPITTTINWRSTNTTTTTKKPTIKTTTKDWRKTQTTTSTTRKPTTTTTTAKTKTTKPLTTTRTSSKTTTKLPTSTTKNPFDHSFFKKNKEQAQALLTKTTTKPTTKTA